MDKMAELRPHNLYPLCMVWITQGCITRYLTVCSLAALKLTSSNYKTE
jgi:hypothetical protein